MRLIPLVCLYSLVAGHVHAAPTATATNTEALMWPNRGPYQKVGRYDYGLGAIKMPVPVVEALRRDVSGDPSTWYVSTIEDFSGQKKRIVNVIGQDKGYLSLLVARGTWTILSVPRLNEVLDPLVPADLQDRAKLEAYLFHIIRLWRYQGCAFLDLDFRRGHRTKRGSREWLQGTETHRSSLVALCHEPVVTKSRDRVTIGFNLMNPTGGVEHWTFHLRLNQAMQLEGMEARLLRKNGTFFYPVI